MRFVLGVIILVGIGAWEPASGQDAPIPDTLDWRQYYPLQIGNVWEYKDDNFPQVNFPSYTRRAIVKDTLLEGQLYFVQVHTGYNTHLQQTGVWREFLRYDTTYRRIEQLVIDGCCPGKYDYPTCSLYADFNQLFTCETGGTTYISGGYHETGPIHIGDDSLTVSAVKHFCFQGPCISLAHGIGDIGGVSEGGNNTIGLIYLKRDDREFGRSVVTTDVAAAVPPGEQFGIVTVFPNPSGARVNVGGHAPPGVPARLDVYDILGRRLWSAAELIRDPSGRFSVEVDGTNWPAGIYMVHLTTARGSNNTKAMVLAR